ncbi:cysteine-rich repeat secretory protein 1-like [Rhodamnia argentea]|uniref:Cysteine-rich repeat secretory protein 1-like n=1 Tax=Rhodamnia argentea TaxID=178133 RepID=A0A8B8PEM7_9MYRT|nr:cysteine-rich repeat secretory protein 1-like [Rhodamnia argentea]
MALFLLPFMLSLSTIKAADPTQAVRGLYCSNSSTFASKSAYQANLKRVLDDLVHRAGGPDQGTCFTSKGTSSSVGVYGSFMCRGGISKKECVGCVKRASCEITSLCQMTKVSILWYDQCMLRYSDTDFYKKVEQEPRLHAYYEWHIEERRKLRELLSNTNSDTSRETAPPPHSYGRYGKVEPHS